MAIKAFSKLDIISKTDIICTALTQYCVSTSRASPQPRISSSFFQVLSLPMVFQYILDNSDCDSMKILRLTLQLWPNCLKLFKECQCTTSYSLLFFVGRLQKPLKISSSRALEYSLTHCSIDCDNCDESPTVNRLYHTLCQLLYSLLFFCFVLFSMCLLCLVFRCENWLWY